MDGNALNWFAEQRLAWIKESIEIFDSINRKHIQKKFRVSIVQASIDLQNTQERWPELMVYDVHTKCYRINATAQIEAGGKE